MLEAGDRWCVIDGDSAAAMSAMADASVDHVITDPPYDDLVHAKAITVSYRLGIEAGAMQSIQGVAFDAVRPLVLAPELLRVSRRWVLAFCTLEDMGSFRDGAGDSWIRSGVWDKIAPGPQITGDRPRQAVEGIAIMHRRGSGRPRWNGGGKAGIWRHIPPHGDKRPDHPTPKPLGLMLELIEQFTDPDDVILDPFCGSGTTLVAALLLGRRAIGIELDPKWAQMSRERCEAEDSSTTVKAKEAGQMPLFGAA